MATQFDPFDSPRRSLARAKHHITDLDARIKTFAEKPPWTAHIEDDDQGVNQLHKLKLYDRIDDTLASVAFDASNNLRAVLDQMAFGIAVVKAGTDAPKSAKFPFGKTEADATNNAKGGCKDLPTEIRELFIHAKPYQGGNDLLWALNELANTKKHKMLIPITLGGAGVQIMFTDLSGLKGNVTVSAPTWDPEKNELVFLSVPSGSNIGYKAHFRPSVTFDDVPDPIRGEPPVLVLNKMVEVVEGILMATEAECRRIGLIS
jgi:hypothetical protein